MTQPTSKRLVTEDRGALIHAAVRDAATGKADLNPVTAGLVLDGGTLVGLSHPGASNAVRIGGRYGMTNAAAVGTAAAVYYCFQSEANTRARLIRSRVRCPLGSQGALAVVLPEAPWDQGASALSMAGLHMTMSPYLKTIAATLWNPIVTNANHVDYHLVVGTATAVTLSGNDHGTAYSTGSIAPTVTAVQAALNTALGAGHATARATLDNSIAIRITPAYGDQTSVTMLLAASTNIGPSAAQLLAYGTGTAVNIFTGNTPNNQAWNDGLDHPLTLGVSHDTSTIYLLTPDGSFITLTHPGISAFCGPDVTLEPFCNNLTVVDDPVTFDVIGVSGLALPVDLPYATRLEAARLAAAAASAAVKSPIYQPTGVRAGVTARTFTDGSTTSGSNVLTSAGAAAFTAQDIGRLVTGTGIPAGTTITTFTDATHVVMSANATATAASGLSVVVGLFVATAPTGANAAVSTNTAVPLSITTKYGPTGKVRVRVEVVYDFTAGADTLYWTLYEGATARTGSYIVAKGIAGTQVFVSKTFVNTNIGTPGAAVTLTLNHFSTAGKAQAQIGANGGVTYDAVLDAIPI